MSHEVLAAHDNMLRHGSTFTAIARLASHAVSSPSWQLFYFKIPRETLVAPMCAHKQTKMRAVGS